MTTLNSIVVGALKKAGMVGAGQIPPAYMITDALHDMNQMTELWASQGVNFPADVTLTLQAGKASYTIGTGGELNTARPVRVLDSLIRISNTDYPVKITSSAKYDAIGDKTIQGRPVVIRYEQTMPRGTITFFPVPDANYSFILNSVAKITEFTTLDIANPSGLPPGFDIALEYNLAVILAANNGRQLLQAVYDIARTSYQHIEVLCSAYRIQNLTGIDPTGQSGDKSNGIGWFG
jgi:hypothetical protein